jgi:hypothetical protein
MAGMSGLGRVFDTFTVGSGNYFSVKNASAVSFIVQASGASSVALTAATTFAAGTTLTWTTGNGFGQTAYWYQNVQDNGTGAWTKQTAVWTTNSIALAQTTGYMSVFSIYTSQFADTYDYVKAVGTNTTSITVLLHDLTVQRTPGNLAILGA